MKTTSILRGGLLAAALLGSPSLSTAGTAAGESGPFRRVASFPVFLNTDVDDETVD